RGVVPALKRASPGCIRESVKGPATLWEDGAKMTRTFIAIELGDNVRAALEREILRLARVLPEVRWTTASGLHLTLAFLGELDEAQLAMATEATQEVAAYARRFELQLEGLGSFGPTWAPRVIWAGLAGDTRSLLAVQGKLARALEARGFPREERRFAP